MYLPASGHDWRTLTLDVLGLDNLKIYMTGVRIEETYDRRRPKLRWKKSWLGVAPVRGVLPDDNRSIAFLARFFSAEITPLD